MTEEEKIVDFATVRDLLMGAQERRRDLTYEQRAALFTRSGQQATTEMDTRPMLLSLKHSRTPSPNSQHSRSTQNSLQSSLNLCRSAKLKSRLLWPVVEHPSTMETSTLLSHSFDNTLALNEEHNRK